MKDNVLISFLHLLKIKYTKQYSNRIYAEHPHKYNLFGLSSMLSGYGIENVGLKITNKNDIHLIDSPFIAHLGNDFAIVEKNRE